MPHRQIVQARAVLTDQDNYPEVIVGYAQQIVQWSDAKNASIQWLWTHREILRAWRRAAVGKNAMAKSRAATHALATTVDRQDLGRLHEGRGYLRSTKSSMAMTFGILDAQLKTLACTDLALMHRYVACCNAKRLDASLESVAFLHWVNGREANEILLWRMLRNQY